MDNGSALSGVGVSDALWGSTVATTTSDNDGDFSQASLSLGYHSVTYSKSGYLGVTLTELLETDGETLNLETVRLLDEDCASGTMSGSITNAVTGDNMSGVNLWYIKGKNKHFKWWEGTYFGTTPDNGSWSLPNPNCQDLSWISCGERSSGGRWVIDNITSTTPAGWYTIRSKKSGYYQGYHDAQACGDKDNQNNSLSSTLNVGEMRIILRWPKTNPVTAIDLDVHLSIPDNDSTGTFHLWNGAQSGKDYYIYGANDNVTIDKDHKFGTGSPPGDETITITKVRSGTYSFSVHNYTDMDNDTNDCCPNYKTNLLRSNAKVKVFYNDEGTLVRERFYAPNSEGTLWRVFTFDSSGSGSGFTRVDNMSYENTRANIY